MDLFVGIVIGASSIALYRAIPDAISEIKRKRRASKRAVRKELAQVRRERDFLLAQAKKTNVHDQPIEIIKCGRDDCKCAGDL